MKILKSIGGIDDALIERAAPERAAGKSRGVAQTAAFAVREKAARAAAFAARLKWAAPVAACLVIAAIALPQFTDWPYSGDESANQNFSGADAGDSNTDDARSSADAGNEQSPSPLGAPSLKIDEPAQIDECYAALEDWRGLPAIDLTLDESASGVAVDREVFQNLDDLKDYADAFVLAMVREVKGEGENMQTALVSYAETIGDRIVTRLWNDVTVSTGSRVLIRQRLIGGCTLSEANNFLRKGGVYVLPLKFNEHWTAYEAVGDFDVLFELDDTGAMHSHSKFPDLNKYDGMSLPNFLDEVRELYPAPNVEFTEQAVSSVEQAERQASDAYITDGFRKFSLTFDAETVVRGADVYLFRVSFGDGGANGSEYAAIAKSNGAFLRFETDADGETRVLGGLGGFPKAE